MTTMTAGTIDYTSSTCVKSWVNQFGRILYMLDILLQYYCMLYMLFFKDFMGTQISVIKTLTEQQRVLLILSI